MKIKVNGKEITLEAPCSVAEFVAGENYPIHQIAVEKNKEIIPKSTYESNMLADGDVLEVVTFVGGG